MFKKHQVSFFQCPQCSLLQTEDPYWLDEAYAQAYTRSDTGLAARTLMNRFRMEPILNLLFGCKGAFLDVGGGYGLFTRLIRDIGINCFTTDKYCKNVFAPQFEPSSDFTATALFSFEVFEHLPDPKAFLEEVFSRYKCKTIFFSTETFSSSPPGLDWPYYGFFHSQHITFYHPKSLEHLAESLGCCYTHLFSDLHLISERPLTFRQKLISTNRALLLLYALWVRCIRWNKSFTYTDSLANQT